jgi:hypothetical protein
MVEEGTKTAAHTEETVVRLPMYCPNASNCTNTSQRNRWKALSKPPEFFEGCKRHAMNFIIAENYERQYYFHGCENITFQSEDGRTIWSTDGGGEINLPAGVMVYIVKGKMKSG